MNETGDLNCFVTAATDRIELSNRDLLVYWDDKECKFMTANYQSKNAQNYMVVDKSSAVNLADHGKMMLLIAKIRAGKIDCPIVIWDSTKKRYVPAQGYVPAVDAPITGISGMINDYVKQLAEQDDESRASAERKAAEIVDIKEEKGKEKEKVVQDTNPPQVHIPWNHDRPDPTKVFCTKDGTRFSKTGDVSQAYADEKNLRNLYYDKYGKNWLKKLSPAEKLAVEMAHQRGDEIHAAYVRFSSGQYPYWEGTNVPAYLKREMAKKPGLYAGLDTKQQQDADAARREDYFGPEGSRRTQPLPTTRSEIRKSEKEFEREGERLEQELIEMESFLNTLEDEKEKEKLVNESITSFFVDRYQDVREMGAYIRAQCCRWGSSWMVWRVILVVVILAGLGIAFAIYRKYSKKAPRSPWINERAADVQLKYGDGTELTFKPNERVYITIDEKPSPRTYKGVADAQGQLDLERLLASHGHMAGTYKAKVLTGDLKFTPRTKEAEITFLVDKPKTTIAPGDLNRMIKEAADNLKQPGVVAKMRNAKRRVKRNTAVAKLVTESLAAEILEGSDVKEVLDLVKESMEEISAKNKKIAEEMALAPLKNESIEEAEEAKLINEAWTSTNTASRFLYQIGNYNGNHGSVRRVEDCLVTNAHVLESIMNTGAAQIQVCSGKNSASISASFPLIRGEWVEIEDMEDMVALPLPKCLAAMPKMPVEVLPMEKKNFMAKIIMVNPQSREASMDTKPAAVVSPYTNDPAAFREITYYTDHQPGFSGCSVMTDTNPVKEVAIHSQGATGGSLLCKAYAYSDKSLAHIKALSCRAPVREALTRFTHGLN